MQSKRFDFEGHSVHYQEVGEGPVAVMLHGWPTSAFLYRNVAPIAAQNRRVVLPDLIGFGKSNKPLDVSYSFRFHARMLDALMQELGADQVDLVVHDLGGPVGLWWACEHPERIRSIVLLNTLVYPRPTLALLAFILAAYTPGLRHWMTGARGLEFAMDVGTARKSKHPAEVYEGAQAPFPTMDDRRALLKAALGLTPKGMFDIGKKIGSFDVPIRGIYGVKDRILPDIGKTMKRIQKDLPQAQVTALENCGHFLQEDDPETVGRLVAEFFSTVE